MSTSPVQRGRFDPFPKAASPGWAGGAAARQPLEKQRKGERLLCPCWVHGVGSPFSGAAPAHGPRRQPGRLARHPGAIRAWLLFPKAVLDVPLGINREQQRLGSWPRAPGPGWGAAGTLCVCVPAPRQRGSSWIPQTRGAWAAPPPHAQQLPLPSRLAGAPRVRLPEQPALSECLFAIKQPKEE